MREESVYFLTSVATNNDDDDDDLFPCRAVVLFRPKKLNNKFEDSLVKYGEEKITSSKIKKFIQDNV